MSDPVTGDGEPEASSANSEPAQSMAVMAERSGTAAGALGGGQQPGERWRGTGRILRWREG